MSDAEEIEVYVDPEMLTKAKGALMLENGREPTDDEVIGEALQAFVDGNQTTEVDNDDRDPVQFQTPVADRFDSRPELGDVDIEPFPTDLQREDRRPLGRPEEHLFGGDEGDRDD